MLTPNEKQNTVCANKTTPTKAKFWILHHRHTAEWSFIEFWWFVVYVEEVHREVVRGTPPRAPQVGGDDLDFVALLEIPVEQGVANLKQQSRTSQCWVMKGFVFLTDLLKLFLGRF